MALDSTLFAGLNPTLVVVLARGILTEGFQVLRFEDESDLALSAFSHNYQTILKELDIDDYKSWGNL